MASKKPNATTALAAMGHSKLAPNIAKIVLLSQAYPLLLKLPLPRSALVADLSNAMDAVAACLTESAKSAKNDDNAQSALGVLCKQVAVHAHR